MGSLKKSANELGYSKDFMAQLDTAQAKTIERLRTLRQEHAAPKVAGQATANQPVAESPDTQPTRSRK